MFFRNPFAPGPAARPSVTTPDRGILTEHRKLVQQVLDFESALKSGKAKVTMDIMRFLKDWLVQHIMGTDPTYLPFLRPEDKEPGSR